MKKKKITLSNAQYDLLQDIRGLNENAHMMVMTAKRLTGKWELEGDEDTIGDLVCDLYDEIELQPRSKSESLARLICKIQPDCEF